MDPHRSPITTPGVDDTPYIRFAIDQLTRDEEIRGTRHYNPAPEPAPGPSRARDTRTGARQPRTSQQAHPILPSLPPSQRTTQVEDYPVETGIHDEGLGYMDKQREQQKAASAGTGFPAPSAAPARHPQHTAWRQSGQELPPPLPAPPGVYLLYRTQSTSANSSAGSPDVFIPFRAPIDSPAYPPLNFLPGILRPVWLGLFIFLVILMLVGLMFSAIWSGTHRGLWPYRNFGDGRYFVFEFLPIIFGMILLIWLFEVESAATRLAPFLGLSSQSTRARSNAAFLDLYPTQFLIPRIEYFRSGQPLLGACFLAFWLFLLTIPLLASSFNVQFFGPPGTGEFRWVAVQGVIWTCIALYIIMLVALITLAIHLRRSVTGLKWDPRSIADIVALLERSNIMSDYAGTETFFKTLEFRQRLWNRTDRLGYWTTTQRPNDIFYGIGEEGGATRVYSIEGGRIKEKPHAAPGNLRERAEALAQRPLSGNGAGGVYSIRSDIRALATRRRYLPWYLRDSALIAWSIIAIILYVAFLVVSFVNDALHNGFSPSLHAGSNSAGFSAANFLYSFIPALLAMLLYLAWQPIDFAYRHLEPFAQMSDPDGATAVNSILLDYTASLPLMVSIKALANGHWTLAFVTLMTLVNVAIPILASGLFWGQFYTSDSTVRIAACPAALYALSVFLGFYAVSFFALYRGRKRRALPHEARNLAQLVSWLYMSRLLSDRAFARCQTKAELVTRLLGNDMPPLRENFMASMTNLVRGNASRTNVADRERVLAGASRAREGKAMHQVQMPGQVRYGFGVYVGRDGREHLGIDRVRREGAAEMVLFDDSKNAKRRSFLS